ncbi:MAG: glycosyltransferase family 4 protein [Akkermansiaceae bacterium]
MSKILLPISLDRVRSPISTLLRYIALSLPEHSFVGGSNPSDGVDAECAKELWQQNHIRSASPFEMAMMRFDIVHHASATPKNLAAARLAKIRSLGKVKHIFTANCEPYSTDPYLKYMKRSLEKADVVVAVSEAVARGVKEYTGRNVDCVIPNGFDELFYTLPENYESSERPFFLFCAQILDRKNPDFFLDLAGEHPECDFVMVGNNPYPDSEFAKSIMKRVSELDNVKHLGMRSRVELRELMQQATALLFPSDYEGLPLTVVEAMGCGCPVIAQPKSSLPEVIQHNNTGWLYLIEESASWKKTIAKLLSMTDDERHAFASTVRNSVVEKFTWSTIARLYGELYARA